ncbi:MAG: hypothetical protein QOJ11_544 [Frankiales bacterium]|jgi:hypothetical protein|nr:hypothetical protein [Frankiales bacterium]
MFTRARSLVVVAALAASTVGTATVATAAQAAPLAKPGLVGGRVILQDNAAFSGYDMATDGAGNTYIGWIGDDELDNMASRQVYLCTLPPASNACKGGIQVIPSLDISGAAGLRVLATASGAVTLLWSHQVGTPAYQGRDGRIAIATSQSGGPLSAATDISDAPSFSTLYDAEFGPGGALWTVVAIGAGTNSVEVRKGIGSPAISLPMSFSPGSALLAFSGATPVIAAQVYGAISKPVMVSHNLGSFTPVARTWTAAANIGLVAAKAGVRLIASVDSADYFPVVAKWTGSGFGTPHLTGDKHACAPSSHDLNTDASGRLVDVSQECGKVTVADLPTTTAAALFQFPSGGTFADGLPQIATTPRGHGVVAWTIESTHGNRLYFNRILLPGLNRSVSRISGHGRVTLTGPVSCLPGSTIAVSVKGTAAAGWKVGLRQLVFGGRTSGAKLTINGAALVPGKVYTLVGKVHFTKGGLSSVGTETLKFRSCINP